MEQYNVKVTNEVKTESGWVTKNSIVTVEAKNESEAYFKARKFGTVLFVLILQNNC